jgi:hypothetical protein
VSLSLSPSLHLSCLLYFPSHTSYFFTSYFRSGEKISFIATGDAFTYFSLLALVIVLSLGAGLLLSVLWERPFMGLAKAVEML